MKKIKQNCIITSAAFSVPKGKIKQYKLINKKPENGDLVYAEITRIGQHMTLESTSARIHTINTGTRAVMAIGHRYAPDYYEGFVPEEFSENMDLMARGGIVGRVVAQNDMVSAPTQVKILGYVCNSEGKVINSQDFAIIQPKKEKTEGKRAKLILCVGAAMNSGKSYTAAACCYSLSSKEKKVRAAKVTGTASLKDILLMEDCGAQHIADFTYLGFPSTYMLNEDQLLRIFKAIDAKYGNNPNNYLVIEFADGLLQRETAMLLHMPEVRKRIHKLIFCAQDAFGIKGGLELLKEKFDLVPAALSGVCSSSPLAIREIKTFTELPILYSAERNYESIFKIIK